MQEESVAVVPELVSSSSQCFRHQEPNSCGRGSCSSTSSSSKGKGKDDGDTTTTTTTKHPSVVIPEDYMFHAHAWKGLSSIVKNSPRPKEIVVEWEEGSHHFDDDETRLMEIAKYAMDQTQEWFVASSSSDSSTNNIDDEAASMLRVLDLHSSLTSYVKHCRKHLTHIRSFKLKLGFMYGPTATRCPLWHADNVPLRWIQAYLGPGTVYLDEDKHNNRQEVKIGNDDDDDDDDAQSPYDYFDPYLQRVRSSNHNEEAKKLGPDWKYTLVDLSGIDYSQSPIVGEPTMLCGRMFPAWSQQTYPTLGPMAGVLHRSPHNIPRNQERILLNLDVVCAYQHDDDEQHEHHHHHHGSNCGCQQ